MVDCSFCGHELERGTGKMYIKKDGKIFYFCSHKCQTNHIKLGRNPVTTKWTKYYAGEQ